MKSKRYLLVGVILGAIIGWALGFLRIPHVASGTSFLVGAITCLAIVALVTLCLFAWNQTGVLRSLAGRHSTGETPQGPARYRSIWVLIVILVVTGVLLREYLIDHREMVAAAMTRQQDLQIAKQAALVQAVRNSSITMQMSELLADVDDVLAQHPGRHPGDDMIARIAIMSRAFQPYRYLQGDTLSSLPFSPERGQLLVTLAAMQMDSGAFAAIMETATFEGADVSGADLRGMHLEQANLRGANLQETDLSGAFLIGADLSEANGWGANLRQAILNGAQLKRADLRWSQLNGAQLAGAYLGGAQLADTEFREADFSNAFVQWADCTGADLRNADLSNADFRGVNLSMTNLSSANLTKTDLTLTTIDQTNFSAALLAGAAVTGENWLELLAERQVIGATEIQSDYQVVNNPKSRSNLSLQKKSH